MALKATYDDKSSIPEKYQELYSEQDGKYVLTGVEGVKTQADIDNVQAALTKERGLHRDAENQLKAYDGIEADGLSAKLEELAKLQITGGKLDDSKLEEIVAQRLELDRNSFKNKQDKLTNDLQAANSRIENLVNEKNNGLIESQLRDAAIGQVNDTAMHDVLFRSSLFEVSEDGKVLTKSDCGVTPGLEPKQWLDETLKQNTHWQKTSKGAGATGSKNGSSNQPNKKLDYSGILEDAGVNFN